LSLEADIDHYDAMIEQMDVLIKPLSANSAALKNQTIHQAKVNQIWAQNFKIMDNVFNQLKKKIKGFKAAACSYPKL